jgi:hypothetical protein
MRRAWLWGLLLAPGCVVLQPVDPFACDDSDGDGSCDADDPCPADPQDDADGDGVCAPDDACATGSDAEDVDGDAVPDACDLCPGVADVDEDGDALCDDADPCPGDPTNGCAESVWVGVQADVFYEDIDWTLQSADGQTLALGNFRSAGDGYFQEVLVDGESESCVVMNDAFGDGGGRGIVFNLKRQLKLAEWEGGEYLGGESFCFRPKEGSAFTPPRQNVWLSAGQCRVEVRIFTGLFPAEVGWRLESYEGRVIQETPSGSFSAASTTETAALTLTDGDYRFFQLDSAGDGWIGRNDTATYEVVRVGDGTTLATGQLQGGSQGSITFVLDCP